MAMLHWKLKQVLEAEGLTPYRIMVTTGLAGTTVYRLANGQTNAVDGIVLDKVLTSLKVLTGKDYRVEDLIEWIPDPARLAEIEARINA